MRLFLTRQWGGIGKLQRGDRRPSRPHPELVALRRRLVAETLIPPDGARISEVRSYLARLADATKGESKALLNEADVVLPAGGRRVRCKLYPPDQTPTRTLLLYAHGGGFRHGELAHWDAPLRQLVRESGVAILSIGYALAPEHPFPQAFNEVSEIAAMAVQGRYSELRMFTAFALGGDSAGANLALGAALALRDNGVTALRYLMLLYGVYSMDLDRPSWRLLEAKSGHGLSRRSMAAYWSTYAPDGEDDWRVEPLIAKFHDLPPTRITVGDLDPLLDENLLLAQRLRGSGVNVDLKILEGIAHGIIRFNEATEVVRGIVSAEADALARAMGAEGWI